MRSPYLGEIRMFGGSFAPVGWAFCNGQPLPISEFDVLFSIIGTTYGGDGQSTFALPNLNGRVPIHMGQGRSIGHNYQIGETGGVEAVTITNDTLPVHNHSLIASEDASTSPTPTKNIIGKSTSVDMFISAVPTAPLAPDAILPVGESKPHDNMQPYAAVSYIISLDGIFPNQN
jgi:microcystin-dependent protein